MIRQRALAWAAVLSLVATVSLAPLPLRFTVSSTTALAQDISTIIPSETTDLAIAVLNCAEAPATEALTSFFTTGTAPSRCSAATGVTISVSENDAPLPDSPFTTDVAGIVVLPVNPGSAVEVQEDPKSIPAGYEPLTQVANGVPYANPVQIDSAAAGAAVLFVNVPRSVASTLAQDVPVTGESEPTDLAVVALQCADAPDAETLTSFFNNGTPPGGCAPAEGVRVAVTENEQPLAGSPFTTDADGALAVPVRLGAAVAVKEDPQSLPAGYEPLTQKVNGVAYANPVQINSATANAAVLFVNVPASVAARLAREALAVDAGPDRIGCDPAYPDKRTCIAPGRPLAAPCSITNQRNFTVLAPDPRGLDADRDGIGCEPIAPRGGTVVRVASVDLDSSGNVRRAAPPARTRGNTVAANPVRSDNGVWAPSPEYSRVNAPVVQRDRDRAGLWYVAPTRPSTGNVAIASNPVSFVSWRWTWPNRFNRDDWIWQDRYVDQGGVRFLPDTISTGNVTVAGAGSGNVAIASNPIFISNGVWAWPDRNHGDDWAPRNRFDNGNWLWPNRFNIGNVTITGSGDGQGNVAIASNPVFIGNGLWSWPNHHGNDDWFQSDVINIGNITVAGTGNGNVAIASNPVFISSGLWHWSGYITNDGWFWNHGLNNGQWREPNRFGPGVWGWPRTIGVGNLVTARSGGNIAIVSNPVVIITSGLWFVPPDRNHDDHWYDHDDRDHGNYDQGYHDRAGAQLMPSESAPASRSDAEAQAIDSGAATDVPSSKVEPLATSEQPPLTVNGEPAVELAPTDANSVQSPGNSAVQFAAEGDQEASDDDVALSSEGTIESPGGSTGAVPVDTGSEAAADASAPSANEVAPDSSTVNSGSVDTGTVDAGYVAPAAGVDAGYVAPDPAIDPGYVDPGYVEQEPTYVDTGEDAGYIAPEPVAVEPSYADPVSVDTGNVDTGYVAPDPVSEPAYSAPQANYDDPGVVANDVAPAPIDAAPEPDYVAPEPSYVDAGNGMASPDPDAGFGGPDAGNVAPEPNFADSGMDAVSADNGNVDNGNFDASTMAPDPGMDDGGSVAAGDAADAASGGDGRKGHHNHD